MKRRIIRKFTFLYVSTLLCVFISQHKNTLLKFNYFCFWTLRSYYFTISDVKCRLLCVFFKEDYWCLEAVFGPSPGHYECNPSISGPDYSHFCDPCVSYLCPTLSLCRGTNWGVNSRDVDAVWLWCSVPGLRMMRLSWAVANTESGKEIHLSKPRRRHKERHFKDLRKEHLECA